MPRIDGSQHFSSQLFNEIRDYLFFIVYVRTVGLFEEISDYLAELTNEIRIFTPMTD